MKITEIFYSIQGEGDSTGFPTIFIRTTGCNLRCSFCDTQYAYEGGTTMTITEILNTIKQYPCSNVCLTGGEPLLQQDITQLLDVLVKHHYTISVETNGSLPITALTKKKPVMISLDIKCPSSKMHTKMNTENIPLLRPHDQIKFIIQTRQDYEYAKTMVTRYKPSANVFFQPVWKTDPARLASWIL
ncbi:MAG: radical SAM protein, partial [Methanobacteriota archaeon]